MSILKIVSFFFSFFSYKSFDAHLPELAKTKGWICMVAECLISDGNSSRIGWWSGGCRRALCVSSGREWFF